ncbi:DivIVA domain-containing protein [Micromonospora sp. Llam7]|uniref:DivIVA domain-containing protein n=1 Tax=Micromonospora tarapacensis TaxID=2835305 RepID=UPI001C830F75|nr:DivIVA domain-containing protein [Micromonospora tarapacensis]MBX7268752.1 DivIVA domain-containing protein [Micromonospora tarapacensis]
MIYVSGERLHPHHVHVRAAFDTRWRGVDPDQVNDYLNRVADELDRLHRELPPRTPRFERIRQALRQWQSRHTAPFSPNSRGPQ